MGKEKTVSFGPVDFSPVSFPRRHAQLVFVAAIQQLLVDAWCCWALPCPSVHLHPPAVLHSQLHEAPLPSTPWRFSPRERKAVLILCTFPPCSLSHVSLTSHCRSVFHFCSEVLALSGRFAFREHCLYRQMIAMLSQWSGASSREAAVRRLAAAHSGSSTRDGCR